MDQENDSGGSGVQVRGQEKKYALLWAVAKFRIGSKTRAGSKGLYLRHRIPFFFRMGLSIVDHTNTVSAQVGAYSSVHSLRSSYILWAIEYLKKQIPENPSQPHSPQVTSDAVDSLATLADVKDESDSEDETLVIIESAHDLIRHLEGWLTYSCINYDHIHGNVTEDMVRWNMTGLMHFVNCSDCEGSWSYGQCVDIVDFYNILIPFKEQHLTSTSDTSDKWHVEHMKALRDVFVFAVERRGHVIRC